MNRLIASAIRRLNEQNERVRQAAVKRVRRFQRLAANAKTDEQRARYQRIALQSAKMAENQIKKSQATIEALNRKYASKAPKKK